MRERLEAAREGAGFGCPTAAAITALEGVGAEGGEAELVDAVSEAVEGLADSESESAGAAGEAVELGVEVGELAGCGKWIVREELGGLADCGRLDGLGVLACRECWDLRAGTPHDY